MLPPTQIELIELFKNTALPTTRPGLDKFTVGYQYGTRIFCCDCKPRRARAKLFTFGPGEWTSCATCSFMIGFP